MKNVKNSHTSAWCAFKTVNIYEFSNWFKHYSCSSTTSTSQRLPSTCCRIELKYIPDLPSASVILPFMFESVRTDLWCGGIFHRLRRSRRMFAARLFAHIANPLAFAVGGGLENCDNLYIIVPSDSCRWRWKMDIFFIHSVNFLSFPSCGSCGWENGCPRVLNGSSKWEGTTEDY